VKPSSIILLLYKMDYHGLLLCFLRSTSEWHLPCEFPQRLPFWDRSRHSRYKAQSVRPYPDEESKGVSFFPLRDVVTCPENTETQNTFLLCVMRYFLELRQCSSFWVTRRSTWRPCTTTATTTSLSADDLPTVPF
jgi:hypothetical protein